MKDRESASAFRLRENIKFLLFYIFILFLYSISLSIHAEEGSKTDSKIEILLSEGKYSEAEKLATSALEADPTDSKAEFSLTKAWIGLGKEAKEKKNWKVARAYFEKAFAKWPLNSELRKELEQKTIQTERVFHTPDKVKLDQETLDTLNETLQHLKSIDSQLKQKEKATFFSTQIVGILILLSLIMIELGVLIIKK